MDIKTFKKEYVNKKSKPQNKYNAEKKICAYGHRHDSILEAKRCEELHLLEKSGAIEGLELQKSFLIIPGIYEEVETKEVYKVGEKKGQNKTKKVCIERPSYYKADFVYYDKKINKTVIEDSKGKKLKEYILKRKLVRHQYCNENTIFIESH